MAVHVREVLLCFFGGAGAETLIVLHLPRVRVLRLRTPRLKLRQTEEGMLLTSFAHLTTNDRGRDAMPNNNGQYSNQMSS